MASATPSIVGSCGPARSAATRARSFTGAIPFARPVGGRRGGLDTPLTRKLPEPGAVAGMPSIERPRTPNDDGGLQIPPIANRRRGARRVRAAADRTSTRAPRNAGHARERIGGGATTRNETARGGGRTLSAWPPRSDGITCGTAWQSCSAAIDWLVRTRATPRFCWPIHAPTAVRRRTASITSCPGAPEASWRGRTSRRLARAVTLGRARDHSWRRC